MRFQAEQRFSSAPPTVAAAYSTTALYEALIELPIGRPEVLSRSEEDGTVRMEVRYRFAGSVSGAARRVVDPDRLTWVEQSVLDLSRLETTFVLVPDHYGNLLRASGRFAYLPDGSGTCRRTEADIAVSVPFVGRAVEGAIASGLAGHLTVETPLVERFLVSAR